MPVGNIRIRRAVIGLAAFGTTVTVLAWGVGFGDAKPHVTLTPRKVSVADEEYMRPRASPAVPDAPSGRILRTWNFRKGLPSRWEAVAGAQVSAKNGAVTVTTNSNGNDVQVRSPAISLPPGSYRLLVDGAVSTGGMQLGVEAADGQSCSAASYYDARSVAPGRSLFAIPFFVVRSHPVSVVLANWAQRNRSSVWQVRRIRLAAGVERKRAVDAAARYAAGASPLMPLKGATAGTPLFRWTPAKRLPSEWVAERGVSMEPSTTGLVTRTTRQRYGYQLMMTLKLKPGSYLLWLDARIAQGGMTLGAENLETGKWLNTRSYWYGQRGSSGVMATPFSLHRPTTVELVLANWAMASSPSVWILRGIELDQLLSK